MSHTSLQMNNRVDYPFSLRNRLTPIALLTLIFFLNILARFVWGPLLVNIEKELGINHAGAGALFIYITVGYFFGMVASGVLSHKINHRKTIILSCYICGILLVLTSFSGSFLIFRIMLACIGASAGLYLPSGIASLTYNLDEKDYGKAFAIHEISPSLALVAGPILVAFATGTGSWRGILWPIGLVLCLSGLLYSVKDTTGEFRGDPLTLGNVRKVISLPAFWIVLVIFTMGIVASMAIYSMLPLYLQAERGFSATYSNLIVAIPRVMAIAASYAAGWLIVRFSARPVMMASSFMAGVAIMALGLFSNQWLWLPLVVQPLLATAIFPPAYAILAGMVPAGMLNIVVLLLSPTAMLFGGGIFPAIIGAFGDAGRFHSGFLWAGLLVAAGSFLILGIKPTAKPTKDPSE